MITLLTAIFWLSVGIELVCAVILFMPFGDDGKDEHDPY